MPRIARLDTPNPGATHERTYTYDNNGNLTSITAPSTPYYNRVYEYDALNRLTSATAEDACEKGDAVKLLS